MAHEQASIRSDLGRARGLGSAKDGFHHWWVQRVSAVALIPLSLFWLFNLHDITTSDYAHFMAWIGSPFTAIPAILFIIASFYHAALGMQVVIEDYVPAEGWRITLLLINKLSFALLGVASVCAIAWLSLASHLHIG